MTYDPEIKTPEKLMVNPLRCKHKQRLYLAVQNYMVVRCTLRAYGKH